MPPALRSLFRAPTFTAIALLTIALGIGANTALFSIFDRLILSPLDLPQPDRLVRLWANNPDRNLLAPVMSVPKYELFSSNAQSFSALAASTFTGYTLLRDAAEPEQLAALDVTASYLPTLGLQLLRGRNFSPDDEKRGAADTVIVTEDLWRTRFAARDDLLGSAINLAGVPHTVIGILRSPTPSVLGAVQLFTPRALVPGSLTPEQLRGGASYLQVTARLKPGLTFAAADTETRTLSQRYATSHAGNLDAQNHTELRTWLAELTGNIRPTLYVLLTAVGLVLLIACANVSNLFLSRLTARHKEIAIRLSLGATRGDLIRQFLLETALFCALATGLGLLLALWSLDLIERLLYNQLQPGTQFALNAPTLAFTVAVSVLSCALIGLVPALHASRANLSDVLKDSARGAPGGVRGTRFRSALVVVEVALSVLLLVGSSLLFLSFLQLQSTPPGFQPRGVASAAINIPTQHYKTPAQQLEFVDQILAQLRTYPQIKHAAATSALPAGNFGSRTIYAVKGQPVPTADKRPSALLYVVSEDFFSVLGIPLRAGRLFTPHDRADAPGAVIVNESFAKKLFPGQSALGQTILRGPRGDIPHEIVGIVGDVKSQGLNVPAPDTLYFPVRQLPRNFIFVTAVTDADALALQPLFRSAVGSIDRTQAIALFSTLENSLRNSLGFQRLVAQLTAVFAGLALLLSALGLYSVLAYAVTQRTSEIGIRMALGASRPQILTLILRHGLKLVALGLFLGLVAAAATSHLLQRLLFNIRPLDPLVYAAVALAFAAIATLACLLPARRATKVDPLVALRTE